MTKDVRSRTAEAKVPPQPPGYRVAKIAVSIARHSIALARTLARQLGDIARGNHKSSS